MKIKIVYFFLIFVCIVVMGFSVVIFVLVVDGVIIGLVKDVV